MHSTPLANQQDTICSGWVEGAYLCKHGHRQTMSCNPYISPFSNTWHPKTGPVCVIGDVWIEKKFHFQGTQDKSKSCKKCGDKLTGHEDETSSLCRWCVTGWTDDKSLEKKDD